MSTPEEPPHPLPLPLELRNKIYNFALPTSRNIIIQPFSPNSPGRAKPLIFPDNDLLCSLRPCTPSQPTTDEQPTYSPMTTEFISLFLLQYTFMTDYNHLPSFLFNGSLHPSIKLPVSLIHSDLRHLKVVVYPPQLINTPALDYTTILLQRCKRLQTCRFLIRSSNWWSVNEPSCALLRALKNLQGAVGGTKLERDCMIEVDVQIRFHDCGDGLRVEYEESWMLSVQCAVGELKEKVRQWFSKERGIEIGEKQGIGGCSILEKYDEVGPPEMAIGLHCAALSQKK